MEKYWNRAISFEEYLKEAERRIALQSSEDEHNEYYQLGLQRMNRALKTFNINETQLATLQAKNFSGKILIISEPWCGDASATVPAVVKFFEAGGYEVKIFLRDSDASLIDQFLTDGARSIPKVVILNKDFSVKNSWGPRPKQGLALFTKFKENPETYPREEFYNDLQIYYAKNRGADAIEEILELL
ncbi:MAG: thioredoxin family protein [Chitinophagaceae bacterium]|jgi:hypothetical protein|nr:thioredoxin family protein [Chitinophagaceae bacterium]